MVLVLLVFLWIDYHHVIPYNRDVLANLLWNEDVYTTRWFLLLFGALVVASPILFKQSIGFIGLAILIAVILKPIIVGEMPHETAEEFLSDREQQLVEIVNSNTNNKIKRIRSEELESLGIEQLVIEGDTYIFIVNSLINNANGFVYDKDGELPSSILQNSKPYFEEIKGKWYEFSVF